MKKKLASFDEWRNLYDDMTYRDQVDYYNEIEKLYPEQAHYQYNDVRKALEMCPASPTILEFGCWKGDLAQRAIPEFNVKSWKGVEICEGAIKNTHCNRKEFSYIFPDKFDWFADPRTEEADIIIATHFIEHLSNEHFEKLLDYCKGVKLIHFEAPLNDAGQGWAGYGGTHILGYGWNKITELMADRGYKVAKTYNGSRTYICE